MKDTNNEMRDMNAVVECFGLATEDEPTYIAEDKKAFIETLCAGHDMDNLKIEDRVIILTKENSSYKFTLSEDNEFVCKRLSTVSKKDEDAGNRAYLLEVGLKWAYIRSQSDFFQYCHDEDARAAV